MGRRLGGRRRAAADGVPPLGGRRLAGLTTTPDDYDPTADERLARRALRRARIFPHDEGYDDALQVALMALVRAHRAHDPSVRPWGVFATIVMARDIADWKRVRRRHGLTNVHDSPRLATRRRTPPARETLAIDPAGREHDPAEQAAIADLAEYVRAVLPTLSPRLRAICEGLLAGHSFRQVGAGFGRSSALMFHLLKKHRPELMAAFAGAGWNLGNCLDGMAGPGENGQAK